MTVAGQIDALAQEIRRVDGENSLGAGALAEALMPFLAGQHRREAEAGSDRLENTPIDVISHGVMVQSARAFVEQWRIVISGEKDGHAMVANVNTVGRFLRLIDRLAASPSSPASGVRVKALEDVAAERQRQMDAEGWTPEHDDGHKEFELSRAAATYALWGTGVPLNGQRHVGSFGTKPYSIWPWGGEWWKPRDRRRNLVKAGALILAEIERLDRLSALGEHP
jgi:hypothetical protein